MQNFDILNLKSFFLHFAKNIKIGYQQLYLSYFDNNQFESNITKVFGLNKLVWNSDSSYL